MNTVEINEALARKVLEIVDAGLVNGLGLQEPGKMCVEAAVNFAMASLMATNQTAYLPHCER